MIAFTTSRTSHRIARHLAPLSGLTGLAAVIALGTYAFVFYPADQHLADVARRYDSLQHLRTQHMKALDTQKLLAKFWKRLPARQDFTDLSVAISDLATRHGVHIPGMGYDIHPLKNRLAAKGTLSFTAAGRYEAIRRFMYDLESTWPSVFIESLKAERAKNPQEVAFTLKVSTYLKETGSPSLGTLSS